MLNNNKNNNKNNNQTGGDILNLHFSGLSVVDELLKEQARIEEKTRAKKVHNGFSSIFNFKSKRLLSKKIAAFGLTIPILLTAIGCTKNAIDDISLDASLVAYDSDGEPIIPKDHIFNVLLNTSKSELQREVLGSVGNFLADYNIRFADLVEETVTIENSETKEQKTLTVRPALTWDEVMSMALVYNDFSKEELVEILNGGEVDAYELNNSYKMAILQLMGAHVLETRDNPVNIDMVVHTKEGKAFYEKYHNMFLKCKETTEEEKLESVKKFYDELYKDFPITEDVRTKGISHSDARASIEPYKFSIIPMVAASEIMFQNLEVDHTLTQQAIDYLNDIGACNIAEDILEKAQLVSLTSEKNDEYADYYSVRDAMILFLEEKEAYVIDDMHRELTYLSAFQEIVNGFFLHPYSYTIVSTYSVTEYFTEREEIKTSDRDEAVELAGEEAVSDAEKKAQEELDRENQAAKDEAEKEADKIAGEMQDEEDQKREDLENKVEESDKEYQENIDNANDNINNGGTVNEDDLGHGTDFDNNHSDSNGNLDDSVTDITTDGSGAANSSDPLPDPNAEGYSTFTYSSIPESDVSQSSDVISEDVYEYEEPYEFTSEEEIDQYIESLAAPAYDSYGEFSKVYKKM